MGHRRIVSEHKNAIQPLVEALQNSQYIFFERIIEVFSEVNLRRIYGEDIGKILCGGVCPKRSAAHERIWTKAFIPQQFCFEWCFAVSACIEWSVVVAECRVSPIGFGVANKKNLLHRRYLENCVFGCNFVLLLNIERKDTSMKANFSIQDLELNIETEYSDAAEGLLQQGALKKLNEVERNLWSAQFVAAHTAAQEAEVQLQGSRVRAFTCECTTFKNYSMCQHIAATLWALRERKNRLLAERDEARRTQQSERKLRDHEKLAKLTIPNILRQTETAQLLDFVADYARQNKPFALALKARFGEQLNQDGDHSAHYQTLLTGAVTSVLTTKGNITNKGWTELFAILDEMRQKSSAQLAIANVRETATILIATIPFLHRFLRRDDAPVSRLMKRYETFLEQLAQLQQLPLAIELQETLWQFGIKELREHDNDAYYIELFFRTLLLPMVQKNKDWAQQLTQTLDELLRTAQKQGQEMQAQSLVRRKIEVLQQNGEQEAAFQLIMQYEKYVYVLETATRQALERQDFGFATRLARRGLELFAHAPANVSFFEQTLLQIAQRSSDAASIIELAQGQFLKTLDIQYFELLKAHHAPPELLADLTRQVENLPFRLAKRDALGAIYFAEKQYDKLVELIHNLQSLELLKMFGVKMFAQVPDMTLQLYQEVLVGYLDTHLGRQPAQRVRSILEAHWAENATAFVQILTAELRQRFHDRHSLMEELEAMETELFTPETTIPI
jgi:hypothetical protein